MYYSPNRSYYIVYSLFYPAASHHYTDNQLWELLLNGDLCIFAFYNKYMIYICIPRYTFCISTNIFVSFVFLQIHLSHFDSQ